MAIKSIKEVGELSEYELFLEFITALEKFTLNPDGINRVYVSRVAKSLHATLVSEAEIPIGEDCVLNLIRLIKENKNKLQDNLVNVYFPKIVQLQKNYTLSIESKSVKSGLIESLRIADYEDKVGYKPESSDD